MNHIPTKSERELNQPALWDGGSTRNVVPLCTVPITSMRAPWGLDEGGGDGRPQPGATAFAGTVRIDPMETVEHMAQVLGRDSGPVIVHLDQRRLLWRGSQACTVLSAEGPATV